MLELRPNTGVLCYNADGQYTINYGHPQRPDDEDPADPDRIYPLDPEKRDTEIIIIYGADDMPSRTVTAQDLTPDMAGSIVALVGGDGSAIII